ncbi:putative lipid II flippase FtsW [bacterium]|nr:putative lipid II flippase FtsW [bacterium]
MKSVPKYNFDNVLFLTTIILLGIGVVMVYSSSSVLASRYHENSSFFLIKQGISAFLGLVLMFFIMRIDYQNYKSSGFIYPLLFLTGILLLLVFVPGISEKINGARRWIKLYYFSFQPSEIAKIVIILYLAYFLDKKNNVQRKAEHLFIGPAMIIGFLLFLIIKEPDFSTCMIILVTAVSIYFIAGLRVMHIASIALCFIPAFYFLIYKCDYRWERILAYIRSILNPLEAHYQVQHSILAMGNGGLSGLGFGNSAEKYLFLPLPHSDFIFSIIGEEFGLLGTICIVLFFSIFIWRGFLISKRAKDVFGTLLAGGITFLFAVEIIINIGVTSAILPVSGVVLPFISCGGSSLIAKMIQVGILLNISIRERG